MNELKQRQVRTFEACELAHGIEALVIGSPTPLQWLAGVCGWGCRGPQFLVLRRVDGAVWSAAVVGEMDRGAVPDGAVDEVRPYPDDAVDSPTTHPIATVVLLLEGLVEVGADTDGAYFRARYLTELGRAGVLVVDCTVTLAWARAVKSPAELDLVRRAGRTADAAMASAVRAAAGPDSRRCDVAAVISSQQIRAGGRSAIPPIVVQGRAGAHENWDTAALTPTDTLRIELAGVGPEGYHAPLSRTLLLPGSPPWLVAEAKAQHRVLATALSAGVRALHPGVTCDHVYRRVARVLAASGMDPVLRVGYSFGLGHTPEWGDGLSIRAGSTDRIPEGACIHLILGCGNGWRVRASETCIVGPDGAELVCRTPRRVLWAGLPICGAESDPWVVPTLLRCLGGRVWPVQWAAGTGTTDAAWTAADQVAAGMLALSRWARSAHHDWWPGLPGGRPHRASPLHNLDDLGRAMGLDRLWLKDETARMGGRSFRMLGVTAAVHGLMRSGEYDPRSQSLATMSNGNHGAALAAIGVAVGGEVEVWIPQDVDAAARQRLVVLGATVHVVDGSYDDAVAEVARACDDDVRVLVSNTAFGEYEDVPQTISAGYMTLFAELEDQCTEVPTHLFVQCGVGGLACAAAAWLRTSGWWDRTGHAPPRLVVVEAAGSACYLASSRTARATTVATTATSMKGLNCGTPSTVAWPLVAAQAAGYVAISDEWAGLALDMLVGGPVETAATGASGLAGLAAAMTVRSVQAMLGLTASSRVVCLVTEAN
jgi:diaminopropionate ammonia-lyase